MFMSVIRNRILRVGLLIALAATLSISPANSVRASEDCNHNNHSHWFDAYYYQYSWLKAGQTEGHYHHMSHTQWDINGNPYHDNHGHDKLCY